MRLLQIGICEDNQEQLIDLKGKITTLKSLENISFKIHCFSSGIEVIEKSDLKLDILFMDIIMPGKDGFYTSKAIREYDPNVEIIFTTAEPKYVFKGYEVNAYRYLIKPISKIELERHIKSWIEDNNKSQEKISLRCNSEVIFLNKMDIIYAEINKKRLTIHTKKCSYELEMTLKKLEDMVNSYKFFRCHHSYLINLEEVDRLSKASIGICKKDIPVSRNRMTELKKKLTMSLSKSI